MKNRNEQFSSIMGNEEIYRVKKLKKIVRRSCHIPLDEVADTPTVSTHYMFASVPMIGSKSWNDKETDNK